MPITAFGWDADVYVSSTPSISASNETATDSGDHITYTFTIHKYWDDLQPIIIQYSPNGTTGWVNQPLTDYTFQACGGVLVFLVARTVGVNNFIRISSGYYMAVTRVADGHEWSFSMVAKLTNTTRFQTAWEESTVASKSGTAKVMTYVSDNSLIKELSNRLVLILYTDKSVGTRWECYAYLNTGVMKWAPTAIVTQDLDYILDTPPYYYAS